MCMRKVGLQLHSAIQPDLRLSRLLSVEGNISALDEGRDVLWVVSQHQIEDLAGLLELPQAAPQRRQVEADLVVAGIALMELLQMSGGLSGSLQGDRLGQLEARIEQIGGQFQRRAEVRHRQ